MDAKMKQKGLVYYCFIVLFMILMSLCNASRRFSLEFQNLEIKKQLTKLNKTPLQSIKSSDGDTIDCVHISHQPAFDHPLLQNHTIQVRPNYHPEEVQFGMTNASNLKDAARPVHQLWQLNGRCPEGTIPIRRTKKEDILRASSIERFGKKKHKSFPKPRSAAPDLVTPTGHEHAIAYVKGGQYYGAKATMNVWQPQTQQPNEFSLSQIWLLGGTLDSDLNSIEAGWQVSPDLYGDNNTRLFTYWTSDSYQGTGCYNLLCSGFVQVNHDIALGASISPLSTYSSSQYDISLLLWKDPKEGNWWLQFGKDHVLGYWPASLYSYLADSASMVEWGGEVVNLESDGLHTTTQMGSGHFPEEGFARASYFKNIQVVDGSNNLRAPSDLSTYTELSNCYDVQLGKDGDWGSFFFYGGPGRNPNCS